MQVVKSDREQLFERAIAPPLDETELALADLATFEPQLDDALRALGLHPLGDLTAAAWFEVDREQARRQLLHGLRRDLAYGTVRRDAVAARALASALLDRWPEPARYLVSSDLHRSLDVDGETPRAYGYGSGRALCGTHEFEQSLIVLRPDLIAVHVVADDD